MFFCNLNLVCVLLQIKDYTVEISVW